MPLKTKDIIRCRLINQKLVGSDLQSPAEVVHHLGVMQSQEYKQAKWAIGLRLPGVTDSIVENAFNEGKILRTHILRPTWHFVTPDDIYWIQAATAHRVQKFLKSYLLKYELDIQTLKKSMDIITDSLEGKNYLTRKMLQIELNRNKIIASGSRLAFICMNAELEMLMCSGPRIGKQFTYALLSEKLPVIKNIAKDEAIAKLAGVYFKSRGPATIKDFCWWSSLTVKEANQGLAETDEIFKREVFEGQEYIYQSNYTDTIKSISPANATFFMPDYDEYGISYNDRSILFSEYYTSQFNKQNPNAYKVDGIFFHIIIINGIAGAVYKLNKSDPEIDFFRRLNKKEELAVKKATKKYKAFYELKPHTIGSK